MAGLSKIQALACAGAVALSALACAPAAASAQTEGEQTSSQSDDGMRLSGGVRLAAAYDPIDVLVPELIAAPDADESSSGRGEAVAALDRADSEGSASALPWFERFTVAPSEPKILWSGADSFEVEAGDRWGVTLGYSQAQRSPQSFELEDFRAGAFFELTERVRLGGQVRFTSPEEEIFGEETEDRAPEIRFESAFKF